jgi:hypothetical protein
MPLHNNPTISISQIATLQYPYHPKSFSQNLPPAKSEYQNGGSSEGVAIFTLSKRDRNDDKANAFFLAASDANHALNDFNISILTLADGLYLYPPVIMIEDKCEALGKNRSNALFSISESNLTRNVSSCTVMALSEFLSTIMLVTVSANS